MGRKNPQTRTQTTTKDYNFFAKILGNSRILEFKKTREF